MQQLTSISSVAAVMKAPSPAAPPRTIGSKVKLVQINGLMMKYRQWWMPYLGGTSTVAARREIDEAAADDSVGAILLHVDSPGGQVPGTDDLALAVRAANARKPVVAFLEDLAASAAYYVASQSGRIVANESAIVGSLGTLTLITDSSVAFERAGIRVHAVGSAPLKTMGVPGTEVTAEQLEELQTLVDRMARLFLDRVASGRSIPPDQARALFDGRVWGAKEARRKGLVDEVGTLDGVIGELVQQTHGQAARLDALRAARSASAAKEEQQKPAPRRHRSRWERSGCGVLA